MAQCPKKGLFGWGGTKHLGSRIVRVSHFTVTKTGDGMTYDRPGPWTRLHWRCTNCGQRWTVDKVGHWEVSDFR